MMKKFISILLFAVATSLTFSSCEDMLTGDMDRHVEAEEVSADTLYGYWGILRSLQGIAERYVILGECRGDLVDGTAYVQDSINTILDFLRDEHAKDGANAYHQIADYYHVINSCNTYLSNCDVTRINGLNQSIMEKEYAQVASIRAWVYLQLVLTYGRVPYFDTPMLSTADMEAFREAEQWVDANTLAQSSVVQKLEEVRMTPVPDYGEYSTVAYASQCIFPQNVVLGDIYLLAGGNDKNYYRQAAQRYYDFLNTNKGGILRPNDIFTLVDKNSTTNQYYPYASSNYMLMFSSRAKTSNTEEIVTVIPSSTNKLWGRVLRDVNELFGHTASITVTTSTSDTTTTAVVALRRNFEHQLGASKAYADLNKTQDFEAYIGSGDEAKCTVLTGAGDARYRAVTEDFTDYDNGGTEQVNFVMKQNPYGGFTTTYPVIYRKGSIWLRFAAALNGAGFPGYAFAILRHGLCGNPTWVPSSENNYEPSIITYSHGDVSLPIWAIEYWDDNETVGDDKVIYDNMFSFFYHIYQKALDSGYTFTSTLAPTSGDDMFDIFVASLNPDNEGSEETKFFTELYSNFLSGSNGLLYINPGKYYGYKVREGGKLHYRVTACEEQQVDNNTICDYISYREMQNAKAAPFLDFSTQYLRGSETENTIALYSGMTEYSLGYGSYSQVSSAGAVSVGIHSRGCGLLRMNELSKETGVEGGTTYNYVNQINKMRKAYEGVTTDLTINEIYDPANLDKVQCAIADLIIDEMALETCFEGSRFYDLLCYSRILNGLGVNGNERIARKIANRSGSLDGALYSRLQNPDNWYLPRP